MLRDFRLLVAEGFLYINRCISICMYFIPSPPPSPVGRGGYDANTDATINSKDPFLNMMTTTMRYLICLLSLILFSFSAQAGLLKSGFDATFNVYVSGIYAGVSSRHLTRHGKLIEYRSQTVASGLASLFVSDIVTEVSQARYEDKNIVSLSYRYQQTGGKDKVDESVMFDWDKKKLHISHNNKTYPIQPHSYDILSFQLALMRILSSSPKKFVFHVADYHDLHTYDATLAGKETIDTEYGELGTWRVDAINRENGNRFTFWCAPKLDYLPVRVKFERADTGMGSMTELKSLQLRGTNKH